MAKRTRSELDRYPPGGHLISTIQSSILLNTNGMRKIIRVFFVGLISLFLGTLFTTNSSVASKPLISFCYKNYSAGGNAKPAIFQVLSSKGACSNGLTFAGAVDIESVVSTLNAISTGMLNEGWSFGNYQTSLGASSCIPGQPGCIP